MFRIFNKASDSEDNPSPINEKDFNNMLYQSFVLISNEILKKVDIKEHIYDMGSMGVGLMTDEISAIAAPIFINSVLHNSVLHNIDQKDLVLVRQSLLEYHLEKIMRSTFDYFNSDILSKERTSFPSDADREGQFEPKKAIKGQKDLIRALSYLKDKFNIFWDDLHHGNIMIRPSTGDYVATDIGLFHIEVN